jgi:hypothetical protein
MKRLLVNGCSFLAGDEIVWDRYVKHIGNKDAKWPTAVRTHHRLYVDYRYNFRPQYNFASQLADKLGGIDKVDLSDDGSSNDMISLKTISFLLGKSPEERKQFHVCIGWTSVSRLMKYSLHSNVYMNLHSNHYGHRGNPAIDELTDYIKCALIEAYDEDYAMNYVKNILLLENFLKSNGVTYTFFRSLGTQHDFKKNQFDPFNEYHAIDRSQTLQLPKDKLSDPVNWYKFIDEQDPNDFHPMYAISWCDSTVNRLPGMLLPGNGHPTYDAVSTLTTDIAEFIKTQDVL